MTTASILLVDDDAELCGLLAEYLESEGFAADWQCDGVSGLTRAVEGLFDLIVLDVMLPRLDGFEVLRQIRQRSPVPVIMLTARVDAQDRISGLEAGADDYLLKPFAAGELLARIRAVLRRAHQAVHVRPAVVRVGGLRVDPLVHRAFADGVPIELTPTEFDILELLARSAGRVVSRDEISAVLYHRAGTGYERGLDVHMSHLRKKLERRGRVAIRTVRGEGYMFLATD